MAVEEPPVIKKRIKTKDFWKRFRTKREVEVSSGPPPTFDELPPVDPDSGQLTAIQDDFMEAVDRE